MKLTWRPGQAKVLARRVLFHRDYARFAGGHLKVRDYFDHVASAPDFAAEVFVTPSSRPDHLWRNERGLMRSYEPRTADILFVAGLDWLALDRFPGLEESIPVVNLIQGVRHASPRDPRYRFLSRRAIRICVAPEVAAAVQETGMCNGPIHVVPNGVDETRLPVRTASDTDVFIAGMKRPALATALSACLRQRGVRVDCEVRQIDRGAFLDRMARATIAVTLPKGSEGFFLPALEAMFIGCAVVCPDCVGNRGFCLDGTTCLMPEARPEPLVEAVLTLLARPDLCEVLVAGAAAVSARHTLRQERASFLEILKGGCRKVLRNVALTGLPRSGTTLMCHLLNKLPNSVALHEPMRPARLSGLPPADVVRQVETFFDAQRERILREGVATSKATDGKVPANPLADGFGRREKLVNGTEMRVTNVDRPDFSLYMKHPSFFTAFLPHLAPRMECFATVRNPLSVLLSWRNAGMSVTKGRIPAGEAFDPELAGALAAQADVLGRQLFLIDYFFRRFRDHLPGKVVKYEDVVATGGRALAPINPDARILAEPLASRNAIAVGTDSEAGAIGRRLLASENACWAFYGRDEVEKLLS